MSTLQLSVDCSTKRALVILENISVLLTKEQLGRVTGVLSASVGSQSDYKSGLQWRTLQSVRLQVNLMSDRFSFGCQSGQTRWGELCVGSAPLSRENNNCSCSVILGNISREKLKRKETEHEDCTFWSHSQKRPPVFWWKEVPNLSQLTLVRDTPYCEVISQFKIRCVGLERRLKILLVWMKCL